MSVLVGGRTRSARLRKKELLLHGPSILPCSILLCMAADLSRYDDVLDLLRDLPRRVPALQVVVVNGSAVTGGWDEHSDLDVEAWCSGDAATTYAAVLALLRDELPVDTCGSCPTRRGPTGASASCTSSPTPRDLSPADAGCSTSSS